MKYIIVFLFFITLSINVIAQVKTMPQERQNNVITELFFAGLKDKIAENYTNANQSFAKIIKIDAKNDAAYFELANINYRQNKLLEAEIAIKNAILINKKNIWYLKLQSDIYKRIGNMDALIIVLDQLIAISTEEASLYFDKANALLSAGKNEEAQKVYVVIEQKFGASKELSMAKQRVIEQDNSRRKSLAEIERLISENPNEIKNYIYLSEILLDQNKKVEALALLQKAKALETNNYEIDLALADIYQAQNQNDLAMAQLHLAFENVAMTAEIKIQIINQMLNRFNDPLMVRNTIELADIAAKNHPDNAQLTLLFGDILYHQGDLNRAKIQYLNLLKGTQKPYIAWEKVMGIQTLMGQYIEAIKTGEEALSIYPNQAILYYYLAFALHRNGQNAEAGLEINSALLLDSEDLNLKAMIFALQAEVLIDQQKFKDADLAFDKAIALSPNNYLTLSNYAYYLALRNHDLIKAEILASKSAAAMPKSSSIADTYAFVLFKLGKYDQALNWVLKALQNNEALNPVYLEHYGDILYMKGDVSNAVLQWKKAKQEGNNAEKLNRKINEKKYFK